MKAKQPTHTINDFAGLLVGKSDKVATLQEIKKSAASGWSGKAGCSAIKLGKTADII